jgi:hypothetical protein
MTNDVTVTFQSVRRRTINLTKEQKYIIKNKLYFFHENNLPISMTVNRKIITICSKKIPEFKAKGCKMTFPRKYCKRFKNIIHQVIYEEFPKEIDKK